MMKLDNERIDVSHLHQKSQEFYDNINEDQNQPIFEEEEDEA